MRISDWSSDVCSSDLMDIITKEYPGARFSQDKYGNQIAHIPELGSFYVNRSGISMQDVQGLATEGALMFGGAGLGGKVGQAAMGTAGRSEGRGVGKGGVSWCKSRWWPYH